MQPEQALTDKMKRAKNTIQFNLPQKDANALNVPTGQGHVLILECVPHTEESFQLAASVGFDAA